MKRILLIVAIGILGGSFADAEEWKIRGIIGVNYSETAVSDNWSGGETDVRNWMVTGNGSLEKDGEKTNWLNTLKLEYGKTALAGSDEEENVDLIYFSSLYKYKVSISLNPYLGFNTDTQFTDFFDPAVYTESAGIGWNIITKETHNLMTRSGIAFKQTVVSGRGSENETGAEWITDYDFKINEYVKFVSELKMFTAFDAGTDMRWDNSMYVKLGKYFTAQFGYLAVHEYDADMPRPDFSDDIQTRLTFGLGFAYNLF